MDAQLERLAALVDQTGALIALYDADDRLRYANDAFRAAYFIEAGEEPLWPDLMRRNFGLGRGTVINAVDFEEWLRSTQSRRGKTGFRAFESDLHDGRWLWMTEAVDESGWMLCIAGDITHLRAEERSIRQDRDLAIKVSQTDELTGVANRRFVMAQITEMQERFIRAPEGKGCLVVLDIDNFKYINDRFGHQAGDIVLRDFAHRIHQNVRRSDCFGRVGGEEFVLVMPGTAVSEGVALVERLLVIIRASRPLTDPPDFAYSFSAGIAGCRKTDGVSDLYRRADQALYSAKMAGRNRVLAGEQ
ncbi:GGDEF domain-containing protein [Labrys okinawensis]|uniref:GGDEF domain-containing protein n=1 Tax=Labrys okinawensis TaxID=346911 RepID=UPI0039BC3281